MNQVGRTELTTVKKCLSFIQQTSLFKVAIFGILAVLVFFLFWGGDKLGNFYKTYENDPRLFNLDDYILETKLHFEKPPCPSSKLFCFTEMDYADSAWATIHLSKDDHRKYSGFHSEGGTVLYRIKFNIPDQLLKSDDSLGVGFIAPSFQQMKYYLNGTEIAEQDGAAWVNQVGVFSLPREHLINGTNLITFVNKYNSSNRGFLHRYHNLIGAKKIIDFEYITNERSANTYYIVFLALKLGLFGFFALLFLLSETQPFLRYFLIYAFCLSIDSLFESDILSEVLTYNDRISALFNLQCLAFACLWILVEALTGSKSIIQRRLLLVQIIALNLLLYLFCHSHLIIKNSQLFEVEYLIKLEVLAVIFLTLFKSFLQNPKQIIAGTPIVHIFAIFGCYFFLNLVHHYIIERTGNNVQQEIDIVFFYGVAYLTFREFTQNRIRLQESLSKLRTQEIDVRLGRSVSRIAHDLRKPFNNFRLSLQSIGTISSNPDILETMTNQILGSVEYAESLIEEILDTKRSRILNLKPILIVDFLDQVELLFTVKLREKGILITKSGDTDGTILADEAKLISVFQNILTNAEDALGEQKMKSIWIKTSKLKSTMGNDLIRFTIGNSGPTIPTFVIEKLFTAEVTHGKKNGTGIGLAGVGEIVASHNGEIKVKNLPFEKGVEFDIILNLSSNQNLDQPISAHQTVIKNEKHRSQPKITLTEVKKIALIDDDNLIHMAWRLLWSKEELISFTNPETFIEAIESDPAYLDTFDIVITDLYFDKESQYSGIDIGRLLRKKDFTNIILCSGSDKSSLEDEARSIFAHIFSKEILSKHDLLKRINQ